MSQLLNGICTCCLERVTTTICYRCTSTVTLNGEFYSCSCGRKSEQCKRDSKISAIEEPT